MIPWCDQTGTPTIAFDGFLHFRSSIISGSASRMSARMRARVSSRQSPRPRIRWPMSREAGFPVAGLRLLISLAPGEMDELDQVAAGVVEHRDNRACCGRYRHGELHTLG